MQRECEERAETLAEHYEKIQWAVRPTRAGPYTDHLGADLFLEAGPISEGEVVAAGRRLNNKSASGNDGIPPEFWKAITVESSDACRWAHASCQKCWADGAVPTKWHEALVIEVFKKGDTSQCDNYRPISLLQIRYKLFATILLQRLKDAAAKDRIWKTQFGFKSKCGTRDALFLARRMIEQAWEQKEGKLILLALDWAKAFDSISPDALVSALARFGVPIHMLRVIRAIYDNRVFQVRDAGCMSGSHPQRFGICQGCPLSPFLFVMVMTVLMHDAKQQLRTCPVYSANTQQPIEELLYADDILLIHSSQDAVREYMRCVSDAGSAYGLQFNWKKLENMPVRCHAEFYAPNGEEIKRKTSFKYLGSMLCSSGTNGTELSCRLGAAKAEFDKLCRVLSHASLTRNKKLRVYEACVLSKLLYCLDSLWLNTAEVHKLEAFHHRCLRRIAGIKPSFISRVTNAAVRDMLQTNTLHQTLLKRQLCYMSSIATKPPGNVLRDFVFNKHDDSLKSNNGPRRRGRPRLAWARQVHSVATRVAGNEANLSHYWNGTRASAIEWERLVSNYCNSL